MIGPQVWEVVWERFEWSPSGALEKMGVFSRFVLFGVRKCTPLSILLNRKP